MHSPAHTVTDTHAHITFYPEEEHFFTHGQTHRGLNTEKRAHTPKKRAKKSRRETQKIGKKGHKQTLLLGRENQQRGML